MTCRPDHDLNNEEDKLTMTLSGKDKTDEIAVSETAHLKSVETMTIHKVYHKENTMKSASKYLYKNY